MYVKITVESRFVAEVEVARITKARCSLGPGLDRQCQIDQEGPWLPELWHSKKYGKNSSDSDR
jgi:hypothetical protein